MRPIDHIGTGRQLAIALAGHFPRQDWIADLARRADRSRDFVEWHLQEDLEPPPEVLAAAGAMLAGQGEGSESGNGTAEKRETHLMTKGDLPFAGLPGNLRRLRKD